MYDITNYSSIAHIDDWLTVIRKEIKAEAGSRVKGGQGKAAALPVEIVVGPVLPRRPNTPHSSGDCHLIESGVSHQSLAEPKVVPYDKPTSG